MVGGCGSTAYWVPAVQATTSGSEDRDGAFQVNCVSVAPPNEMSIAFRILITPIFVRFLLSLRVLFNNHRG